MAVKKYYVKQFINLSKQKAFRYNVAIYFFCQLIHPCLNITITIILTNLDYLAEHFVPMLADIVALATFSSPFPNVTDAFILLTLSKLSLDTFIYLG